MAEHKARMAAKIPMIDAGKTMGVRFGKRARWRMSVAR